MQNVQDHLEDLLQLVDSASKAIMEVYEAQSTEVRLKADNTPITQADLASHDILAKGLAELFPGIPVVSEEGGEHENRKLVAGSQFWLVDPIDGTREFIQRTGDFTICLGLIKDGKPVFGIVAAPAYKTVYYGGPAMGSYKKTGNEPARPIHVAPKKTGILFASRLHSEDKTAQFIAKHYPGATVKNVGSQLKFVLIAEGAGDAYPRLNSPLHSWDLAAGHAILLGAGGNLMGVDGSPINYTVPTFLPGDFVASSGSA